jgi:Cu-Zn family superoxide dismutase
MTNSTKTFAAATVLLGVMAVASASTVTKYKYFLKNSAGQPTGSVTFTQKNDGPVKMKVELDHVSFGPHAVHIHASPVCDAPDFKGAGGHFNPTHKQHGFDNPLGHHAGDTPGSVMVGEDHHGEATFTLTDITLAPGQANSVPGTGLSVVVHAHGDDEKTDPSGDSGNRIACAVLQDGPTTPVPPAPPQ